MSRVERAFADKEQAFWVLQCTGWVAYGLVRFLSGLAFGRTPLYIIPSISAMVTGFLITLILREAYRALKDKPLYVALPSVGLMIIGFAMLFSAVETQAHVTFYDIYWDATVWELFANATLDAYVLLSWTALYYSINYYFMMQAEKERALIALAQAHEAQLKMLRYQLNPHFLFNTLNAISTLVLIKETGAANQMLTKLSSFLRATLVASPDQKVPLSQELQILGLYLEIEKVRFQDRLRIEYDIEERARDGLVPSLILQPLIENAIKYAIAPAENGGTIRIGARVTERTLVLEVEDDGPGLKNAPKPKVENSSGVGLVNTRDRLRQIYGDTHRVMIGDCLPSGARITIIIPFER